MNETVNERYSSLTSSDITQLSGAGWLLICGLSGCCWIYSRTLFQKVKAKNTCASKNDAATRLLQEEEKGEGAHHTKQSVPYGRFSHPHKSFFDKYILSPIIAFLIPCSKLAVDSKEAKALLIKVRKFMAQPFPPPKSWQECIQKRNPDDFLVGGTVKVPRNPDLLSPFKKSATSELQDIDPVVEIEVTCPQSALEEEVPFVGDGDENGKDAKKKTSKDGFRRFVTCDLSQLKFVPGAQLLIYFHGGAFVLGAPRDSNEQFLCQQLTTSNEGGDENDTSTTRLQDHSPLVVLSVKYRLAPENPFPAAIIDAMSAATFLLDHYGSQCNIHIAGVSAGANLAAVAYFECQKRQSQSASAQQEAARRPLKSLILMDPYLDPTTSSVSYHMNCNQPYVSTAFLRFGWASYLQCNKSNKTMTNDTGSMNDTSNASDDETSVSSSIDFNSESSYTNAWNKSQWCDVFRNREEVGRYVRPDLFLKSSKSSDVPNAIRNSGKIIVTTSMGDPLHDEGIDFVQNIRDALEDECESSSGEEKNNHVLHFDGKGSHCLSLTLDSKAKREFTQAFKNAIYLE